MVFMERTDVLHGQICNLFCRCARRVVKKNIWPEVARRSQSLSQGIILFASLYAFQTVYRLAAFEKGQVILQHVQTSTFVALQCRKIPMKQDTLACLIGCEGVEANFCFQTVYVLRVSTFQK